MPVLVVDCLSCHGTGTALGDPIEVGALVSVFAHDQRQLPLALGAVKSSFAHLEPSAGISAALFCAVVLLNKILLPSEHMHSLNPHLGIQNDQVQFPSESLLE